MSGETLLIGLHTGSLSVNYDNRKNLSPFGVYVPWANVIRLNVIAFASLNATLQPRSQGSLLPVSRRENLGTRLRNTATVLHAAQTRIAMIRACFHARNESL